MNRPASAGSPLTEKLYRLEHPRSLGVYSTYEEVQGVVDALADHDFPVQDTMIVGTDLKLVERVTGRRTWGRVLLNGVMSGLWMGLFVGLLFQVMSDSGPAIIGTSALLGAVFFAVWALIGYAMSGGKRDFTSRVATIPMRYELMVEHRAAAEARRILVEVGAIAPERPPAPSRPRPAGRPTYGLPGPDRDHPGEPRTRPASGDPRP